MTDNAQPPDLLTRLADLEARAARAEERVALLEAALAQSQERARVLEATLARATTQDASATDSTLRGRQPRSTSRGRFLTTLGLGAAGLAAAEAVALARSSEPHTGTSGLPVFNVQSYGASGDGTSDDTVAINRTITDAARAGGIVYLPTGTYRVAPHLHPADASYAVCVLMRRGVILRGAGMGATTIRLAPHAALPARSSHIYLLLNAGINPLAAHESPDAAMGVEDLTVDGNAQAQHALTHGLVWIRCQDVHHTRVRVSNVYGTAASGPAETFGFEFQLGMQASYVECEAMTADGGPSASGFSADSATGLSYVSCVAHGLGVGQGFTHYGCALLRYLNCHAYGNGGYGFNSEVSEDVRYANCVSGGRADGAGHGALEAHQRLGNGAAGFFVRGSSVVDLTGCSSRYNAGHGLWIAHQADGVRVGGGAYSANGGWGIAVAPESTGVVISHETRLTGNTAGALQAQADVNAASPFLYDSGWVLAGTGPLSVEHGLPERPRSVTVYGGTPAIPASSEAVPVYVGPVFASSTRLAAPHPSSGQYYRFMAMY